MEVFRYVIIGIIVALAPISIGSQSSQDDILINLDEIKNSNERTEIQRYTGYEELLTRYLTLPYDVCANTSKQGRYFDISYVLLAIFPIVLLLLIYKNKRLFYAMVVIMVLYLGLCIDTSFVNINGIGTLEKRSTNWDVAHLSEASLAQLALINSYDALSYIASPVKSLIQRLSGQEDHITYYALLIIFLGIIIFSKKLMLHHSKYGFLATLCTVFFFLWLYLSGGIIWYGFLLLPLLYSFIFLVERKQKNHLLLPSALMRALLFLSISCWVLTSYAARIGNVTTAYTDQNTGKSIVDPTLVYFTAGLDNAEQSKRRVYKNIGQALDEINSNNELIYQVGSSLSFEIKNSPQRCFQDNILSMYYFVMVRYKDMKITGDILKASGFKYIIVDLYTYTLDKTPEQSLVKKYQIFLNSLYESDNLRLMATDRILEVKISSNETIELNHLFSKGYNADAQVLLKNHGSYAIFEIL